MARGVYLEEGRPGRRGPRAVVGKYRLLEEIGRGAVGVVYRAQDSESGETLALKIFEPRSDAQRAIYAELFLNEVRASARMRHPNIVPVLDAGREGERFFVVMDFVPGGRTLEQDCARRSLLSVHEVVTIGVDCAEALHYAHRKGVIHRDVKPANVLMDRRRRARLTDFGVAVLGEGRLADTSPFAAAGSPLYMAPEQVTHDQVTPRTDLFALGLILYQLLCGTHPFAGRSMATITRRLLDEEPEPLHHRRIGVPADLSALVQRTLCRDPDGRPTSALELAQDLSAMLDGSRRPVEGLQAEGRVDRLRRLDFFRDFGEAELWELLRCASWDDVAQGTCVAREGEQGSNFYIVVAGRMLVRKAGVDAGFLEVGDCFGELSYVGDNRYPASVVAERGACLLRVNEALLKNASGRCQLDFQRVFIKMLVARLASTTQDRSPTR